MTKEVPTILYKYRNWSNEFHRKLIFEQEIYLPCCADFNDPFDAHIPFIYDDESLSDENIFQTYLTLLTHQNPKWNDQKLHEEAYKFHMQWQLLKDPSHIEKSKKDIQNGIERRYGIFCMSEIADNILLWSHYSDSHKGFCIGFDSQILFEDIGGILGLVTYQNDIPKMKPFEEVTFFIQKILCTKSKFWEYESEYRIIKPEYAKKSIKIRKEAFKEIYLGCQMSFEIKMDLINKMKSIFPEIKIFDLSKEEIFFKLKRQQVY